MNAIKLKSTYTAIVAAIVDCVCVCVIWTKQVTHFMCFLSTMINCKVRMVSEINADSIELCACSHNRMIQYTFWFIVGSDGFFGSISQYTICRSAGQIRHSVYSRFSQNRSDTAELQEFCHPIFLTRCTVGKSQACAVCHIDRQI